jgi:hypothetical protein
MLAEFARVMRPDGVLILSSPNRPEYSDARNHVNPFHLNELDRHELASLVDAHFPAQRWHRQRRYLGSALWSEENNGHYDAAVGDAATAFAAPLPAAMYFVVVAARNAAALPLNFPALSLFTDSNDAELERVDHEAREALRLDALLCTRDAELRDFVRHSRELEAIVADRDRRLGECAAAEATLREQVATLGAERDDLQREIGAQERIIAYRASVRWWLKLPLIRMRRLWNRIRTA